MRMMTRRAVLAVFLLACLAHAASPPTPTFFARRDYVGLATQYVAVADTNGDGIPDIIGTGSSDVKVLFGNGNGTFRQGPTTITGMTGAFSFVAADINHD